MNFLLSAWGWVTSGIARIFDLVVSNVSLFLAFFAGRFYADRKHDASTLKHLREQVDIAARRDRNRRELLERMYDSKL